MTPARTLSLSIGLALVLVGDGAPLRAGSPGEAELLDLLGLDEDQRRALAEGEVVPVDLDEALDTQLAAAVLLRVPRPKEAVERAIGIARLIDCGRELVATGDDFETPSDDRPEELDRTLARYREVGVAALPDEAALELSTAMLDPLLRRLPSLTGAEGRFLWLNQKIQGRETWILSHRRIETTPSATWVLERHPWVGRSYRTLQIVGGFVSVEGGTLIVYANRTTTPLVAGTGAGIKKPLGRWHMRSAVVADFESFRRELSRP